MNRTLSIALLAGALALGAPAQTVTPNLQLNLPSPGSSGWAPRINANFSKLDCFLSSNCQLPALSVKGAITMDSSFVPTAAQQLATKAYVDALFTAGANATGLRLGGFNIPIDQGVTPTSNYIFCLNAGATSVTICPPPAPFAGNATEFDGIGLTHATPVDGDVWVYDATSGAYKLTSIPGVSPTVNATQLQTVPIDSGLAAKFFSFPTNRNVGLAYDFTYNWLTAKPVDDANYLRGVKLNSVPFQQGEYNCYNASDNSYHICEPPPALPVDSGYDPAGGYCGSTFIVYDFSPFFTSQTACDATNGIWKHLVYQTIAPGTPLTYFADTFSGTAGTSLSAHSPGTPVGSNTWQLTSPATWTLTGSNAVTDTYLPPNTWGQIAPATYDTGQTLYIARITYTQPAGGGGAIVTDWQDAGDYVHIDLASGTVYSVVGSTPTSLCSAFGPFPTSSTLTIWHDNVSIRVQDATGNGCGSLLTPSNASSILGFSQWTRVGLTVTHVTVANN